MLPPERYTPHPCRFRKRKSIRQPEWDIDAQFFSLLAPKIEMPGEENAVNVQVAVRCRPVNEEERRSGQAQVVSQTQARGPVMQAMASVAKKKQTKTYSFDSVLELIAIKGGGV